MTNGDFFGIILWLSGIGHLWRSRLVRPRAHDWKSCRRQKRLESSNLSFSGKSRVPNSERGISFLFSCPRLKGGVFLCVCTDKIAQILKVRPHKVSTCRTQFHTFIAAKSPPLPKGGVGGDSVPPPPRWGTSPERGRFIYGSIRESTLPQLFIIHQRSGFIIQYSFVPTYHPAYLPATPCRRRRLREADSLPYGHEGQPRTVGRGLAPAETL